MEALAAKTAGDLALQGSGWAVAVLLGFAVVFLWRDSGALRDKIALLTERAITAIEANTARANADALLLAGLEVTLKAHGQAVDEVERALSTAAADTRHGLGNTQQSLQAIAAILERLKDRLLASDRGAA